MWRGEWMGGGCDLRAGVVWGGMKGKVYVGGFGARRCVQDESLRIVNGIGVHYQLLMTCNKSSVYLPSLSLEHFVCRMSLYQRTHLFSTDNTTAKQTNALQCG